MAPLSGAGSKGNHHRHSGGSWGKRAPLNRSKDYMRYAIFVATGCYATSIDDARARSRMELDMNMYRVGVKLSEERLVSHARRHLIKILRENWPQLCGRAVDIVFGHNPYCLMGGLKQLVVKVARDCIALNQNRLSTHWRRCVLLFHGASPRQLLSVGSRGWRVYYDMLEEELDSYYWHFGDDRRDPPLNIWHEHEVQFQQDISAVMGL